MAEHAKLSASGSEKWLTCTPSARLEADFPDEESEFAKEGTFAHSIFEARMLGKDESELHNDPFYSAELSDYVQDAVDYAKGRVALYEQPLVLVERRLDFSRWVPEGFGTGDLVIAADGVLEINDLKYGKGIMVSAVKNSQMRLYALGAYEMLKDLYEFKTITMTILQPRLNNYSTETMTVEELLTWAEEVVVPRAKLAWNGEGEFVAGEHCSACFCRARHTCKARADAYYTVAIEAFKKPRELLTDEEFVEILDKAELIQKWAKEIQEYALREAELHGKKWPGYKLVEGRSNRKYFDVDMVAQKLVSSGVDEAMIYERSLLGVTALEKVLGKNQFEELLGDLVIKPQGKPTLVPANDKRPELNTSVFSVITEDRS